VLYEDTWSKFMLLYLTMYCSHYPREGKSSGSTIDA